MSFDDNLLGISLSAIAGAALFYFYLTWPRPWVDYQHNRVSTRATSYKFPPSPPTSSIKGHSFPRKNPFLIYESLIEEYGPLISLRVGMERFVVIGRYKAAIDIMEKQGGALVDRPRSVACGELLGRGLRISLTPAGDRFKRMRRALHTHLRSKAAQTYEQLQSLHAKSVILNLLEDPGRYFEHTRAYAASVTLKLTYGKNTPSHASDPDVLEVGESLRRFGRALRPGAYLVDSFPWLKYLPWYGRELREGFIQDRELFYRQMDNVRLQMNNPESGPSFAKFLLTRQTDFGLDEAEVAFLAGGMFSAGSESVAVAISIAMMAAARHLDAQAAVHAELDTVIGSERLPTFDDEKSLPVFRAFILETMRWRPLAPLGLPHRATEDIIWVGVIPPDLLVVLNNFVQGDYYIPAGTTVYGNHWSISRDPEMFPDPDTFDLTRWLTPDGNVRDDLKFPYFGFGRRVCPGQHVATRSLYISTVFVLWAFRLRIDESKQADDLAFLNGVASDVAPIGLCFEPRFPIGTLKAMMTEDSLII